MGKGCIISGIVPQDIPAQVSVNKTIITVNTHVLDILLFKHFGAKVGVGFIHRDRFWLNIKTVNSEFANFEPNVGVILIYRFV